MDPERLRRYRPYLLVVARAQMRAALQQALDPSDVVQEVLAEASQRADLREHETTRQLAWLRTRLGHRVIDAARYHGAQRRSIDLQRSLDVGDYTTSCLERAVACRLPAGASASIVAEQLLVLAGALEGLPERQRVAIELHHVDGLTLAESATLTGDTLAAVAGLIHRGLAGLRNHLARAEEPS